MCACDLPAVICVVGGDVVACRVMVMGGGRVLWLGTGNMIVRLTMCVCGSVRMECDGGSKIRVTKKKDITLLDRSCSKSYCFLQLLAVVRL